MEISIQEFEKYLFLSDIDGLLMRKAINHLSISNQIAQKYNLKSWLNLLKTYENIFNGIIKGKEEYLCVLQSKIKKRLRFKNNNQVEIDINLIEETIKLGSEYIQLKQKKGKWLDYKTSAGVSDTWATGFIAYLGKEFLAKKYYNSAISFLAMENSLLWGYKENYINDSDSSNFALLTMMGSKRRNFYDKIKYLLTRQNKDGGFPTYTTEEIPMLRAKMKYSTKESYAGWTQSHVCVSSVSFHLLSSLPIGIQSQRLSLLQKYLVNKFQTQKTLSYWWTSDIYSIYWCMLSYDKIDNNELKKKLVKRIDELVVIYKSTNLVGDTHNQNSIFYSSMLLKILCILKEKKVKTYENQIEVLANGIIISQFEDGSWASTNALRLPDTDIKDPSIISGWPESERGCNVRAIEWSSLFTTVVATNAIFHYKRIL
jgi:hypothetical protein